MDKESKKYRLWVGLGLVVAAIVVVVLVIVNAMRGSTTGDVTISSGSTIEGVVCKNTTLEHPAFSSKPAESYNNTITATFQDDKLSSISLLAEGTYESEEIAGGAIHFGRTDYNEILTDKYSEEIDIFSANFSLNGKKVQLAQTTRDISKININTVTYFLLDRGTTISKTLEGLKKQYEGKGFTCEKTK